MCFFNREISTVIARLAICMSVSAYVFPDGKCGASCEYNNPYNCKHNCFTNQDCFDEKICCGTGCGTDCVPKPPKPQYDLECPDNHQFTRGICIHECYSNSDCYDYDDICCAVGCGSACFPKKTGNKTEYDSRCQRLHDNTGGICISVCSRNGDCKNGEMCCSNNCGGVCRPALVDVLCNLVEENGEFL